MSPPPFQSDAEMMNRVNKNRLKKANTNTNYKQVWESNFEIVSTGYRFFYIRWKVDTHQYFSDSVVSITNTCHY